MANSLDADDVDFDATEATLVIEKMHALASAKQPSRPPSRSSSPSTAK